jgi:hypothetical protein
MTVGELRREYAEVFGEPTRSFHKEFLVRRIAWRLQANAEGGTAAIISGAWASGPVTSRMILPQ